MVAEISIIYKMDAKIQIYKNHTAIHIKYSQIKMNTYCLSIVLTCSECSRSRESSVSIYSLQNIHNNNYYYYDNDNIT